MKVDIIAFVQAITRSYTTPRLLLHTDAYSTYDTDIGAVFVFYIDDRIISVNTMDPDGEPYEQLYPPIF